MIEQLNGECLAIDYEQFIENDRQTNWDDPAVASGDRQWMYQLCNLLLYLSLEMKHLRSTVHTQVHSWAGIILPVLVSSRSVLRFQWNCSTKSAKTYSMKCEYRLHDQIESSRISKFNLLSVTLEN